MRPNGFVALADIDIDIGYIANYLNVTSAFSGATLMRRATREMFVETPLLTLGAMLR